MHLTIRKALPEDACDYAVCHISCWQSAYKGIVSDTFLSGMATEKEQRIGRYKKVLAEPGNCEYYCVCHGEVMVGFCIIQKSQNERLSWIGEIWAIYLVDEYRGKGFGEEILDFAVNELKRVSPEEIFLWVFESNLRARHFYEKCHFAFDGTTKVSTQWGGPLPLVRYILTP